MFYKWKEFFWKNRIIISILFIAVCTRMIALSRLPAGMLPDEAYGAYNAWGLMTEGMDSRGYKYPVYFVAWGSGMNALYSYLAIPMFWLFGVNNLSYRLPQAIVGIFSVYGIYRLGKELFDEKLALMLAFALTVNPWHIMNMRFGLESNLAPGMFLIGLMFLVIGIKKKGYLIWAAIFLGATLYSYAQTWIMVPAFLLLCLFLFWKRLPERKYLSIFTVLLFLIALPLILFVLINIGILQEIRTPFFSIPKLDFFRGNELSISHMVDALKNLSRMILLQYDGDSHMTSKLVGLYYFFMSPFIVAGIVFHVYSFFRNYRSGNNNLQYVFLIWLIAALFICTLNENISIVHINMIHIPIIFYGVFGLINVVKYLKNKIIFPVCLIFWCISFLLFLQDYIMTQSNSSYFINDSVDKVLERAKELAGEENIVTIFDFTSIKYSYLLWYEKPDISDYYQNVVYWGDEAWEEMSSYGQYRYLWGQEDVTEDGVYIIYCDQLEKFLDMGFEVEKASELYYIAVR